MNDDSIRPALVNLVTAASICLKLGLETWADVKSTLFANLFDACCILCVFRERKHLLSAPAIPAKMIQESPCGRSLHGNSRNMSGLHGVWSWWWVTRNTTVAGCAKGQPNLGYFGCQVQWEGATSRQCGEIFGTHDSQFLSSFGLKWTKRRTARASNQKGCDDFGFWFVNCH